MKTEDNNGSHYQSVASSPRDQVITSHGLLIETLQHHLLLIAGTCTLVLIGVYIYVDRMTPLYTSTARVYVEKEIPIPDWGSEKGVMTQSDNYLYTQSEILKSAPVLATALTLLAKSSMPSSTRM